jgi:hypothetical protein
VRTLYRAIPTNIQWDPKYEFAPTITANGKDGIDFVYISFKGEDAMLRVPREPQVHITPGSNIFPEEGYT